VAPKSPTDNGRSTDTRLSALIERARFSPDPESSLHQSDRVLDQSDRARADPVFSDITDAVERGLRTLDPRSRDIAILKRLRRELKSR
jgi:hypothetical protein